MKPILQTKRGIGGNCLAACLASIFEVALESMPDLAPPECFTDWTVQAKLRRAWLSNQGLDYLEIDLEKQAYHWTACAIPSGPCLFAVESPTPEMKEKGYGHYVVGEVREVCEGIEYVVVHDPLGTLSFPYKVTAIGFFVALNRDPALAEAYRLARKEADERMNALRQLHALIVGDEPWHSWQRIYQTAEQQKLDRAFIVGAIDTLGTALASHSHVWTEGEREIYEQAMQQLGHKISDGDAGEAWKQTS